VLPPEHHTALQRLVGALRGRNVVWALTGSTSFALQGVPVVPKDVDVQTDEPGAYLIQDLFREHITRGVALSAADRIRSHFGALRLGGIDVELMGALQKRREDGTWEPPVDVARLRVYVPFGDAGVPVLPLEYEYRAYARLGRVDTAALIRGFLLAQGRWPASYLRRTHPRPQGFPLPVSGRGAGGEV
jgi:hypothetical protein